MTRLIGAALVAGALVVAGPGAIDNAAAAPQAKAQSVGTSDATDFSAHRYVRRHHRHHGTTAPTTTVVRSTIGHIPTTHRRRSPSASGLVRSGEALARIVRAMRSSLRSLYSWRVHVPVSNVMLGATAKKSDGDQPQSG